MNKTFQEADELIDNIVTCLENDTPDADTLVIVCPPFPYLEMAGDYSDGSYFAVGAQNVSDQESGAYTGEVSAAMLESLEMEYCIVGHSERRAYYHETDEIIARKVNQLLAHGIRPIVCCGEVLQEREENRHTRAGTGDARLYPWTHCREIWQGGGRRDQHPVWRKLQALERERALLQSRRGRRPYRRCIAQGGRLHGHCERLEEIRHSAHTHCGDGRKGNW